MGGFRFEDLPWLAQGIFLSPVSTLLMSSYKPVVFGVAGGTASGKTTVAETILNTVGASRVAYLPHDAYYRDMSHLPFAERAQLNYDHPSSLETELLVAHIEQLLDGDAVNVPVYDFTEHRRTIETIQVAPCPIILVEGILIFVDARLRELMDIKVYVDTAADVRFIRRMVRDLEERGRSLDSIITQYLETVRPMHLEFVEPSKQHADIIIPRGGLNKVALEMVVSRLMDMLRQRQS
jgi:uridine kinase